MSAYFTIILFLNRKKKGEFKDSNPGLFFLPTVYSRKGMRESSNPPCPLQTLGAGLTVAPESWAADLGPGWVSVFALSTQPERKRAGETPRATRKEPLHCLQLLILQFPLP